MLTLVATLLLVAIFFIAGLQKVRGFEGTVSMIAEHLGVDSLAKLVTILVIMLEMLAPLVILYAAITKKHYTYAYIASLVLAVFTLIVTFMFYYPLTSENQLMFMLHLSLAGGLLLLAQHFRKYIKK